VGSLARLLNPHNVNTLPLIAIGRIAGVVCFGLAGGVVILAIRSWMPVSGGWIFPAIFLVVGAGFLRAGYLAVFRWSALALRHVVGALFFLFTVFTIWILFTMRYPHFWIALPVCYLIFRYVAFRLSRYAFPASIPETAGQGDRC
jgi:hypothetical protein